MTVVKGKYSNNETLVYKYLVETMGLNTAAACGIMANIYHESGFNQKIYGDQGTSYGLCQWHNSRFTDLKNYCSSRKLGYDTVQGQIAFLYHEINSGYKELLNTMKSAQNTATGAYNVAYRFCYDFERPANKTQKSEERGNFARDTYWTTYSPVAQDGSMNLGQKIVDIARKQVGKPFSWNGVGPDSFSSSGLIHYCYTQAGYPIINMTASRYYEAYKDSAKSVTQSEVRAGDLLFYKNSRQGIYSIAIATGDGGRVEVRATSSAGDTPGKVEEYATSLGNPTYILRILTDSETSQSYATTGALEDYSALSVLDIHAESISTNLSRVTSVGFDYGYLIDLTHGTSFKFYIPEFTETAGANWESISIIGRSSSILSYNNTNNRSISISLDLYAGVGLYQGTSSGDFESMVSRVHRDANFLKSLEYPDYSDAMTRPPSTVQLLLGSTVNLVGVVSDVTVEHMKPIDSQNRSIYLKVSFKFTQVSVNPIDWSDVREGKYIISSTADPSSMSTSSTNTPNFT